MKPRKSFRPRPADRTVTEDQLAGEKERQVVTEHAAARKVAIYTMLRAHACTGLSCVSEDHAADAAGRDDCLMALGLKYDALADWTTGYGYKGSAKRRNEGESKLNWRDYAACQGTDPEMYFPLPLEHDTRARALAVCSGCDVILQCEEFAEQHGTQNGIFGGRDWSLNRAPRRAEAEVAG